MFSAFNSNTLRVYSWNANGVKKNLEELKDSIIFHNPDLIGIQETHLRPLDRISIPNYTCHISDRRTHRGGGAAIFVKNSIKHHAIVSTSSTLENTTVIIQLGNNTQITMACIYKHPTAPLMLPKSMLFTPIIIEPFSLEILMQNTRVGTQGEAMLMFIFLAIGRLALL
ncbi:hypothetical protein TNCV_218401 [Trichonephila clavipes]|uniref:Endonuclease/exonuclease/phosphatase domain-containing protein n=1 Tax=Trichonephila clavipes TaxID=2585209 RepID=A0A8X6S630_TRICX|nr:hypothetical protein TNCV_218401 [Trichonephila clavipes]